MPSHDPFDPEATLAGLDSARPVPDEVAERVAAALGVAAGVPLGGIDRPRPVPPVVVARIASALLGGAGAGSIARRRRLRVGAAAAVVLVLLGSVAAATRGVDGGGDERDLVASPTSTSLRPAVGARPRATSTTSTSTTAPSSAAGGAGSGGGGVVALDESEPAYARLERFDGCGELLAWVRARAAEEVTEYGLGGGLAVSTSGGPGAGAPGSPTAATPGHSGTNVQEAGVDEPDIVETDGRAIYYVGDGRDVHAVTTGPSPSLASTVVVGDDQRYADSLVLDGDRLAVLLSAYAAEATTEVRVLGVGDPAAPSDLGGVVLSGSYVQARATEHVLHVVTTSAPGPFTFTYPTDGSDAERQRAREENRRIVESSTIDQWVPEGVACQSVRHPRDLAGFSTTVVWSVPFADPSAATSTALLADASTVYATGDRLVLATEQWDDGTPPGGDPVAPAPGRARTQLHRFALAPAGAAYLASGSVPGYIHSSYALSERAGYLRVASTDRPPWMSPASRPSSSTVTVLAQRDDVLVPVGAVGGLGEGEQIQGVRFVDDIAFVVTFRQTDPLYVVDLADPTNPRLRGELHVTGFSAYLHPLGGGRLLGVGIEANEQGTRGGGAVSVYDVSDLDDPTLAQRVETADTQYLASQDPHAFLLWEPSGMLVLPAYALDRGAADVFRVTGGELALQGRITHDAHAGAGSLVARAVVVGSVLYTVGSGGVLGSDATTLSELGWAGFPSH